MPIITDVRYKIYWITPFTSLFIYSKLEDPRRMETANSNVMSIPVLVIVGL